MRKHLPRQMCASTSFPLAVVTCALVFLPPTTQADFGCSLEPVNDRMVLVRARLELAAAVEVVVDRERVTIIANRNLDCCSDYC